MFGQLFPAPSAGRNRDCAGAKRFAAGDIARSVADNVDFLGTELAAVFLSCSRLRERTQLVTIGVIVREGAELKKVPDAVMAKLELRSAGNVSGQKCQDDVFSGF